jgi:small ligand-binding sensory domain FIST
MIGGLVSGGSETGERFLIVDREVRHEGVVGVAMTGNVVMHTVVSQGCRPIGRPFVVTEAEDNVVWRLGGKQALVILHEVLSTLSSDDRDLAQRSSIFAGLAMTEARHAFASGDFLIRNIVGIDPDKGAIAIAEQVHMGQTLQFQLRDPTTSRQELRKLLCQVDDANAVVPPAGCLLFNCTGRGRSLYGIPHQDVKTIQAISGKLPIGGFFCSGEIGPVGGTNFVHGYTASLGLFRPLSVVAPGRHASKACGPDETLAPSSS